MVRYIIGIDPGFGETGVVLYTDSGEDEILEWATFKCPPKGQADAARAAALAENIINEILGWIEAYKIAHLDISLEVPVMGKNVRSLQKQMRVLQEIESGLFYRVAGEVKELWITEINPKQVKVLATNDGGAGKAAVIRASPFSTIKYAMELQLTTLEALADAWAIGLAAWGIKGTRFNFSSLKAAKIVRTSNDKD